MNLQRLADKKLIHPPPFVIGGLQYLVQMGSVAYGMAGESSDLDIYGWCIPPKTNIFPHLAGEIQGFGKHKQSFENWQEHHIQDSETDKEYDFSVYSIVRYFHLTMENNPNMLDSLFVPRGCVLTSTDIAEMVRGERKIFLHKGCFHKFKGYAYAQLSAIKNKKPEPGSKRYDMVQKFGFDLKHSSHLVRLLLECEQVLVEGDLDLEKPGRKEMLRAIRDGQWTLKQVEDFFNDKERVLEKLYNESKIPYGPDEGKIRDLLLRCLEHYYGSMEECVRDIGRDERALKEISQIVKNAGY
jgi:predicted nucleotidyltransferase